MARVPNVAPPPQAAKESHAAEAAALHFRRGRRRCTPLERTHSNFEFLITSRAVSAAPIVTGATEARTQDAASTIAFFAVAATSIVLPLIADLHGDDSFRLPKELVFRGGAIAVILAFVFALTRRHNPPRINGALLRRAPIAIPL